MLVACRLAGHQACERSAVMRAVKSRYTGPEWVVRAMLCAIASATSVTGMLGLQTSDVPEMKNDTAVTRPAEPPRRLRAS